MRLLSAKTTLIGLHQIAAFMTPWLLIYFSGRHGGEALIGEVALWMAVATPVAALGAIPSRNFLLVNDSFSEASLYLLRLGFIAATSMVIMLVFGEKEGRWLLLMLLVVKSAEFLLDIPLARAIKLSRMDSMLSLLVLRFSVLAASYVFGSINSSIYYFAFSQSLGFIVVSLVFFSSGGGWLRISDYSSSLILGVSSFVVAIESNIPRYILGYHEDYRILSLFVACAFLTTAVSVMVNVLVQARLHVFSQMISRGDIAGVWRESGKILLFSTIVWAAIYSVLIVPGVGSIYYSIYELSFDSDAATIIYISALFCLLSIFLSVGAGMVTASKSYSLILLSSAFFALLGLALFSLLYLYSGYIAGLLCSALVIAAHACYYFHFFFFSRRATE